MTNYLFQVTLVVLDIPSMEAKDRPIIKGIRARSEHEARRKILDSLLKTGYHVRRMDVYDQTEKET